MSDDNTSESEESSVHGVFFNEDEQQAFKVWHKSVDIQFWTDLLLF